MKQEAAQTTAADTGRRATKLGFMLTNYDDPDCGQLIAECQRVGVPATEVFRK